MIPETSNTDDPRPVNTEPNLAYQAHVLDLEAQLSKTEQDMFRMSPTPDKVILLLHLVSGV